MFKAFFYRVVQYEKKLEVYQMGWNKVEERIGLREMSLRQWN